MRSPMTYRVYSVPRASVSISPLEKDRDLYKEFSMLDEASVRWQRLIDSLRRGPLQKLAYNLA